MPKPPEKSPEGPAKESVGKIELAKRPSQVPGKRTEHAPTTGERLAADFALRARTSSDPSQIEDALERMLDQARGQFMVQSGDEAVVIPPVKVLVERFRETLDALARKNISAEELCADIQEMIGEAVADATLKDPRRE
jgi:hypothetical protein